MDEDTGSPAPTPAPAADPAPAVAAPAIAAPAVPQAAPAPQAAAAPVAAPAAAAAAPAAPAAPVAYTAFKAGGADLSAADQSAIEATARAMGLTQDAAQAYVDRIVEQRATQASGWVDEIKADTTLGGAKFDESLGVAKGALTQFDPDGKLSALLDSSGMGNHPEVVRFLHRVGKAIGQDGFVPGGHKPNPSSSAQRLYGASNMNP